MKVGIVILNYNSYDFTCNLVRKCLTIKKIDKIVIVDNYSNDNFEDFCQTVEQDKIKYFKNISNSGYAIGNNIGLKYLVEEGYDIGFIANPDTMFETNTIENTDPIAYTPLFLANINKSAAKIITKNGIKKGYEEFVSSPHLIFFALRWAHASSS